MEKTRMLFLGSKPIGYHCLHFLIKQKDLLGIELVGILTNDNTNFGSNYSLKSLAFQHQIPLIDSLDQMPEVEILYSVQYHEILKQEHINKAKKIALNLHMAPLPEYRGCNQFSFALLDGKTEFGTTIHIMDAGIDHGDIIFEKRFSIPESCWVDELYQLTFEASLDLFIETLPNLIHDDYSFITQESLVSARGASIHYRHEIDTIKEINLNWGQEKIERHIRATYMPGFEPPFTIVQGQKIYFKKEWK